MPALELSSRGPAVKGRKPKVAEQRRLEGDVSHRPPTTPALVGGRPDEAERIVAPPNFSRHQAAVWKVVLADLREGGILDRADLATVEAFATAMGHVREIRAALKIIRSTEKRLMAAEDAPVDPIRAALAKADLGHLLADAARGTQANPMLSQERGFLTEARQIGEHLGISPMARTRLGLDAKGSIKPKGMQGELERKLGPSPRQIFPVPPGPTS